MIRSILGQRACGDVGGSTLGTRATLVGLSFVTLPPPPPPAALPPGSCSFFFDPFVPSSPPPSIAVVLLPVCVCELGVTIHTHSSLLQATEHRDASGLGVSLSSLWKL